MILLVLLIMTCALIGTVILIGICTPLSTVIIPSVLPKDNRPSSVIKEPFRDDGHFNDNRKGRASLEGKGEAAIRANLRERIASSSVPTLRSRGMTDEEIKEEIMGDFSMKEEVLDEMLKV